MQRKTLFCALLCAAVLLLTPAVFADEDMSAAASSAASTTVERNAQVAPASAKAAPSQATEPVTAEVAAFGLPQAPVTQLSLSYGNTCIECSVHADCATLCGGGQPLYDYRCQWNFQDCGEHIKQCWCG